MMGFHRSLADMSTFPHPIPDPAAPYSSAKDVGQYVGKEVTLIG
ncbi:MAG: hypothetical protein OJF50_000754 [Nitrospira sp.]|nr:hypothetical protein [Nitrospira sp.]